MADRLFRWLAAAGALLILGLLGLMVLQMGQQAAPALSRFGPGFLLSSEWDQVAGRFGALPFILGTVYSSLIALALAAPIGLGTAIFLSELAPRSLREPVALMVDLLAAIPSVIYGLWALFVLVPWLRAVTGRPPGYGLLAGGLILAVMIVPTIVSISRQVLLAIPRDQREAALALGASRWEMIRLALLPAARPGVVGALILALGRALGETMAVTMVIGNRAVVPTSIFDPAYTLSSVIANEFAEASEKLHSAALMEMGLVLLLVAVLMGALARLLIWRVAR